MITFISGTMSEALEAEVKKLLRVTLVSAFVDTIMMTSTKFVEIKGE